MQGLLSNTRIVDMTSVLMGRHGNRIFGDLGADVVKVASPDGDRVRSIGPMRNPGMGATFLHVVARVARRLGTLSVRERRSVVRTEDN